MADTALKFGPEWMRALCDRGPSTQNHQHHSSPPNLTASPTFQPPTTATSNSTIKYKLAEFRYGREEMLALFDDHCRPPENLTYDNPSLTTNDCQRPLALIPMSDEEHRILSRSANSDVVLRQSNKERGPLVPAVSRPGDRGPPRTLPSPARGIGPGPRTVPRGFTPRSFDDDVEGVERRTEFPRPDKRTTTDPERERPTRVSESDPDGQKPRKIDSRASTETNWRGSRSSAADNDNWRSRQDKTESVAWKDRGSRWRDEDDDLRNGPKSRFGHSREHWVNGDDDSRGVPEWSLDDVGTSIGTFDSSGAFMAESPGEELGGALEDDDGDGEWTKVGQEKRRPRRDSDREQPKNQNRNGDRNRYEREYHKGPFKEHSQPDNYRSEKVQQQPVPARPRNDFDDDCFATSIEQHAEHLVAKWTEEEDESDLKQKPQNKGKVDDMKPTESIYPRNHPDGNKWFYRDPQNAIQGPFTSQEMLGWLKEGYFQPDLLVRRGFDQHYSELGQLMNALGRNPFEDLPMTPEVPVINKQSQLLQLLGQQRQQANPGFQHQKQLQMLEMQTQLRQLLEHLKRQEGFEELSEQEQQQILIRKYAQQVEKIQAQNRGQENVNSVAHQLHQQNAGLPSIWELTNGGVMTASALEEMQRQEQEKRDVEERRLMLETEHRRRVEAEARAIEEENQRKMREMQKKLEEERKANEERIRLQQEEERRKLREEEERRINEEKKKVEEQRRRNEEIRRLNEEMARKQMEAEAERRKEEEMQKFRQQEQERQRIKQQELERLRQHQQQQEELRRMKEREPKRWGAPPPQQQIPTSQMTLADIQRLQEEKEREERSRVQMQQQQVQAMYEAQMKMQKSQMSWPNSLNQPSSHVKTLAEIQKEEADRLSKLKREQELRERENSALANVGIWSNASSQLSWKSKSPTSAWGQPEPDPESSPRKQPQPGFWSEDDPSPLPSSIQRNKPSQSAFDNSSRAPNPPPIQAAQGGKGRRNDRKKEKNDEFTDWCEDALTKFQSSLDGENFVLFAKHDTFPSVPMFVTFLKELESPFDVNDYVRSYLGDVKESREFAKNFLEKRSFYRNQGKKKEEESMWGPAPAITPSVNKNSTSSTMATAPQLQSASMTNVPSAATSNNNNNTDGGDLNSKVKSKKKKSKRVLDTSLLGFTVQADPDRINAGQIEHLE